MCGAFASHPHTLGFDVLTLYFPKGERAKTSGGQHLVKVHNFNPSDMSAFWNQASPFSETSQVLVFFFVFFLIIIYYFGSGIFPLEVGQMLSWVVVVVCLFTQTS